MNWKEKLAEAKKIFDQIKAIVANPAATVEEKNKIEGMLADAKKLQAEAAQLKDIVENAAALDGILEKANKPDPDEPQPQGPKNPEKFADWSEFLYACWRAEHPKASFQWVDPRLRFLPHEKEPGHEKKAKKDMAEGTGSTGGFLVPVEFLAQLQAVTAENSLVRGRATIIRMQRRQITLPALDQTGTTAGVPHWFGGIVFHWGEEGEEKDEEDPLFRDVNLVAHKLYGYTRASDELVEDSAISLADFLAGPLGFAGGVAWMEDFAFINGTGAGQPQGVITAPATIVVPRLIVGGINYVDLCNMLQNFLPSGRGVWFYTQSALAALVQMNGPAANPSYIWQPSAREGVPDTIFGMPAFRTEKCPLIGAMGDIILGDWRYYLIGDRQNTTIETTKFDRWRYDKTSWRVVHRVDGQPWLSAPLRYQDGVTMVSPFVVLGMYQS